MAAPEDAPKARITQVQMGAGNKVRIFVSVADSAGNPLSNYRNLKLEIYESGQLVAGETLSQGWSVFSVLVLDLSGSMSGEKLLQAGAAIQRYIELASARYQIAIVRFSDIPRLVSGFTSDKSALASRVQPLSVGGNTALQDAVEYAMDLFRSEGRHTILMLTDGIENKSRAQPGLAGKRALIRAPQLKAVTISVVGIGNDVDSNSLRDFEATGGSCLEAAHPDQVAQLFEQATGAVATKTVVEYATRQNPDGLRKKLEARPLSGLPGTTAETATDQVQVVRHGFIPDVRGLLAPYAGGLLVLLMLPTAWSVAVSIAPVRRFRSVHHTVLRSSSPQIGECDPNGILLAARASGRGLSHLQPHALRPLFAQQPLRLLVEPHSRGNVCLHQAFPKWLRWSLDAITGPGSRGWGGRGCADAPGDKEEY
jgi:uncharacterized protein YegL